MSISKILSINPKKCTGCRMCEVMCSFFHEKECNPSLSRVHIIKWERKGIDIPVVCQQCEDAPCMTACPVKALNRDPATNAVLVNYDTCIGCKLCLTACPFGSISLDANKRKVIKCDLCGGTPKCAKYCETGALEYVPATQATLLKKREAAEALLTQE